MAYPKIRLNIRRKDEEGNILGTKTRDFKTQDDFHRYLQKRASKQLKQPGLPQQQRQEIKSNLASTIEGNLNRDVQKDFLSSLHQQSGFSPVDFVPGAPFARDAATAFGLDRALKNTNILDDNVRNSFTEGVLGTVGRSRYDTGAETLRKTAAKAGEAVFDTATLGTGLFASKGAMKAGKGINVANRFLDPATKLGRIGATTAEGSIAGLFGGFQAPEVTAENVAKSTALGAGFGATIGTLGVGAGALFGARRGLDARTARKFDNFDAGSSKANKEERELPSTSRQTEQLVDEPQTAPQRLFRGGPDSAPPKGLTAADVVRYETDELGNNIKVEPGVNLNRVDSSRLVWVADSKEAAAEFGKVSEVDGTGAKIIARDPDGGLLVEMPGNKAADEPQTAPQKTDPYSIQDANQEKTIHGKWNEGGVYRERLENSGDIFRELSGNGEPGYIGEKIFKIRKYLTGNIHPEDTYQALLRADGDNIALLRRQWLEQPVNTRSQQLAKDLNLAMVDGDSAKALKLLDEIENLPRAENGWIADAPNNPANRAEANPADIQRTIDDIEAQQAETGPTQGAVAPGEAAPPTAKTVDDSVERNVFNQLPKKVQEKIKQGNPLTKKDVESINKTIKKVTKQTGESPDQLRLNLGVEFEDIHDVEIFGQFTDAATRTTPSGNKLEIAKGNAALNKASAKTLKNAAKELPSIVSRVIKSGFSNLSGKKLRSLAANIQSMKRRSPQMAQFIEEFIFQPIKDFAAYGHNVKRTLVRSARAAKKEANLSKGDQRVLMRVLDGKGKVSEASNPQAVELIATRFREIYDTALRELNRQEIAAGVEVTPYRQDYFAHIAEEAGSEKFLAAAAQADPQFVKRTGKGFRHSKARTGDLENIVEDPFEVMDTYLTGLEGRIGTLVPSRNLKMTMQALEEAKIADKRGQQELVEWFDSINRELTGADRSSNVIDKFQGRVARGIVLANIGSALKNAIQPVLLAGVHPINTLRGLTAATNDMARAVIDGNMDNFFKVGGIDSSYLRSAYDQVDLKKIADKNVLEKLGDAGARIFYLTDMASKKQVIETFYAKGVAQGLDPKAALKQAELSAETMLPSRTPGTLATAYRNNTVGRVATLFQTEILAQADFIHESIRPRGAFAGSVPRAAANIAGLAIAGHVFNEAYEVAFPGQRPAPDPIAWVKTAMDESQSHLVEGKEIEREGLDRILAAGVTFSQQAAGQLPIIGSYFGEFSRSPLEFPVIGIGRDMLESGRNIAEGSPSTEDFLRAGRNLSPLAGRGTKPLFRAGEGLFEMFSDSTEDRKGFASEDSTANIIRSVIGGAYNSPETEKYFSTKDNRKAIIGSFDEQTQKDIDDVMGRGAVIDGEYTRMKSVLDEENKMLKVKQNPKLAAALMVLAEFDKAQGEPVDPLFDKDFYTKIGASPKDGLNTATAWLRAEDPSEKKALEQLNPWLDTLREERSKFFDKVTGTGKDRPEIFFGPDVKKPKIDDQLSNKLNKYFDLAEADYDRSQKYLAQNPEVGSYLDENAKYKKAERVYLGRPTLDEFPEGTEELETLNDQFHDLPKGTGDRSAFLDAHPELIALWQARAVWSLQNEGALGRFEGIEFSQKGLGDVANIATNLVKMPDGNYMFDPGVYNNIAEFDENGNFIGFGSGSGGGGGVRSLGSAGRLGSVNIPTTKARSISEPPGAPSKLRVKEPSAKVSKIKPRTPRLQMRKLGNKIRIN